MRIAVGGCGLHLHRSEEEEQRLEEEHHQKITRALSFYGVHAHRRVTRARNSCVSPHARAHTHTHTQLGAHRAGGPVGGCGGSPNGDGRIPARGRVTQPRPLGRGSYRLRYEQQPADYKRLLPNFPGKLEAIDAAIDVNLALVRRIIGFNVGEGMEHYDPAEVTGPSIVYICNAMQRPFALVWIFNSAGKQAAALCAPSLPSHPAWSLGGQASRGSVCNVTALAPSVVPRWASKPRLCVHRHCPRTQRGPSVGSDVRVPGCKGSY